MGAPIIPAFGTEMGKRLEHVEGFVVFGANHRLSG
jgi:hypothetical protein